MIGIAVCDCPVSLFTFPLFLCFTIHTCFWWGIPNTLLYGFQISHHQMPTYQLVLASFPDSTHFPSLVVRKNGRGPGIIYRVNDTEGKSRN